MDTVYFIILVVLIVFSIIVSIIIINGCSGKNGWADNDTSYTGGADIILSDTDNRQLRSLLALILRNLDNTVTCFNIANNTLTKFNRIIKTACGSNSSCSSEKLNLLTTSNLELCKLANSFKTQAIKEHTKLINIVDKSKDIDQLHNNVRTYNIPNSTAYTFSSDLVKSRISDILNALESRNTDTSAHITTTSARLNSLGIPMQELDAMNMNIVGYKQRYNLKHMVKSLTEQITALKDIKLINIDGCDTISLDQFKGTGGANTVVATTTPNTHTLIGLEDQIQKKQGELDRVNADINTQNGLIRTSILGYLRHLLTLVTHLRDTLRDEIQNTNNSESVTRCINGNIELPKYKEEMSKHIRELNELISSINNGSVLIPDNYTNIENMIKQTTTNYIKGMQTIDECRKKDIPIISDAIIKAEKQLTKNNKTLEKLGKKHEDLNTQYSTNLAQVKRDTDEIEKLQALIDELTQTNERIHTLIKDLEQKLAAAHTLQKESADTHVQDVRALADNTATHNNELAKLRAQVADLNSQNAQLNRQIRELNAEAQKRTDQISNLEGQLEKLRKDLQGSQVKNVKCQEDLSTRNVMILDLNRQIIKLNKTIVKLQADADAANKAADTAKSDAKALNKAAADAEVDAVAAKADAAAAKADADTAKADAAAAKADADTAKADAVAAKADTAAANKAAADANARATDAEARAAAADARAVDADARATAANARAADADARAADADARAAAADAALAAARVDMDRLQRELVVSNAATGAANAATAAANIANAALVAENVHNQARIADLERDLAAALANQDVDNSYNCNWGNSNANLIDNTKSISINNIEIISEKPQDGNSSIYYIMPERPLNKIENTLAVLSFGAFEKILLLDASKLIKSILLTMNNNMSNTLHIPGMWIHKGNKFYTYVKPTKLPAIANYIRTLVDKYRM